MYTLQLSSRGHESLLPLNFFYNSMTVIIMRLEGVPHTLQPSSEYWPTFTHIIASHACENSISVIGLENMKTISVGQGKKMGGQKYFSICKKINEAESSDNGARIFA